MEEIERKEKTRPRGKTLWDRSGMKQWGEEEIQVNVEGLWDPFTFFNINYNYTRPQQSTPSGLK